MQKLKQLLKRFFLLIQTSLILLYLLLEELVWDNIAEPIERYLKHLRLAKRVELFLKKQNRYVILVLFLSMFVVGEGLGLITPIVLAKGYATLAIVIYGFKIVLATFAFWIFNTQKEALLSFKFIDYSYKKIIYYIDKIKSSNLYKKIVANLKEIKTYIKHKIRYIKELFKTKFR